MTRRNGVFEKAVSLALAAALTLPAAPLYAQTTPTTKDTKSDTKKAPATAPASGAAAAAKPDLNEAKKRFASGEKKFKGGDWQGALDDFSAADAIKPTPQTAHYIGLCNDRLGKFPDAIAAYDRFLADVPPKMTKEADETKAREAEIKAMPGKVHVEATPAKAQIAVAGKPAVTAPADIDLAPGKYQLHVSADGYTSQDKDIDVAFASEQDVKIDLEPAPAPPPPPVVAVVPPPQPPPPPPAPPSAEPRSKLPAYVTGGLAVVAAGVGTVFGVMALSDKSDFNKNPTSSTADDGENHALIADMAFGVAITFGVTSAVLFLTKDDAPPSAPAAAGSAKPAPQHKQATQKIKITPSPIVTPHGGGAGALIRF